MYFTSLGEYLTLAGIFLALSGLARFLFLILESSATAQSRRHW